MTAAYPSVQRVCQSCGDFFSVFLKNLTGPTRGLYCSRQCRGMSIRKRPSACVGCGAAFGVGQRGRQRRYCSHSCYAATAKGQPRPHSAEHGRAISLGKTGRSLPQTRRPTTIKVCEGCTQTFELSNSFAKDYREARRFCSSRCWYAYIREHPENHPTFRGGYEPYYGPNWPEQARRARERDAHRCQDCHLVKSTGRLDVHHIVPRRAFDGDWAAANALPNLVTLCKRCHTLRERALDSEYGRHEVLH